jgi:VWFA-related protein
VLKRVVFLAAFVTVFTFAPLAAAQSGVPTDQPTFRSGIELVALNVTVTDAHKRHITNLGETDFQVFEDGVLQDVAFFAVGKVPLDLAVLLDTSASMADVLSLVQAAATGFVSTLGPSDRGLVMTFNDSARVVQGWTSERTALVGAIGGVSSRGGTSLYNALYVALKEFARMPRGNDEVRGQAMVVLSDGEDTASLVGFDEVLTLAKRSGVSIYTISLRNRSAATELLGSARRFFSEADYSMRTLARETGALSFFPAELRELSGVYGSIAEELATQYSMGYTPKNQRVSLDFRRVLVRIPTRPDARARTRTGYLADPPRRAAVGTSGQTH